MSQATAYPKRLIEVDLPIKRISAHARREKSIRHGHISTLHIWWARRPLASCRAVICAALWLDPADDLCPQEFVIIAKKLMLNWAKNHQQRASADSLMRFINIAKNPEYLDNTLELRRALLDFIADFANWDNSTQPDYLETSRNLTQAAHEALGGIPGTKPLVVDPFAGGGAIPLEALRVGADAFASDLNPVAVLLNKVVLEYIPKYGQQLADEVRKWGQWVKEEAEKELEEFYPKDPDGATPIAYLWARTVTCEGPGCGAEVPLMRSLWLAKKSNRSIALQIIPKPEDKRVDFKIIEKQKNKWVLADNPEIEIKKPEFDGTVKRGSATCPCCGYTTHVDSVRQQIKVRQGGALDARLLCIVSIKKNQQGRFYRLPTNYDFEGLQKVADNLERNKNENKLNLSQVPDELLDVRGIRHTWAMIYGLERWGYYFNNRQALIIINLINIIKKTEEKLTNAYETELAKAVQTCLALIVDKVIQYNSSLCRWKASGENLVDTFGRQAIPMVWDFAEANIIGGASGDFSALLGWVVEMLEMTSKSLTSQIGTAEQAQAQSQILPDDVANALITDPPYYDAIPYAYLSDFFYTWLRRSIGHIHSSLFLDTLVPKDAEIVVDRPHKLSNSTKDIFFYERELTKAFTDSCRVLQPDGIGTIVFASKTTSSWEAILKAVVESGWRITGSWPIDTEMESRVAAQGQARLSSSIHLVCRPRNNNNIGDWRDVLQELPQRIHEWMPRLAAEGVVGADAIFACLGPALEIFSRYSSVEKASGEQVTLKEYLEYVWAAVSKEALGMIFSDADVTGFEEDARLTAMWLWTLSTGSADNTNTSSETETDDEDDEETSNKTSKTSGYVLEFDAARKIAQGLGAHLENLTRLVEVKGDKARLLPVSERTQYLFGKEEAKAPTKRKKKDTSQQLSLFKTLTNAEEDDNDWGDKNVPQLGNTTLDCIHQSMILFAAGRSEALKRFLVEEGAGTDQRFWRLAQALSALYPNGTDEKRWVDGVLARKKGLGF